MKSTKWLAIVAFAFSTLGCIGNAVDERDSAGSRSGSTTSTTTETETDTITSPTTTTDTVDDGAGGEGGSLDTTTSDPTGGGGAASTDSGEGGDEIGAGGTTTTSTSDTTTTTDTGTNVGGAGGSSDDGGSVLVKIAEESPFASIVTPAQGVADLRLVTVYDVVNGRKTDQTVSALDLSQLNLNGDIADYGSVNVSAYDATGSLISGLSISAPGWYVSEFEIDNTKHFDLGSSTLRYEAYGVQWVIPAGGNIKVKVLAQFAETLSSSQVNGAWHGFPRSGHTSSLAITKLEMMDGTLAEIAPHTAPIALLYKAEAQLNKLPTSSNMLQNVDMDLMRMLVTPKNGWISTKQFNYTFQKQGAFTVQNLKLRRDYTDMPEGSYEVHVQNVNGIATYGDSIDANATSGQISISLVNESYVSMPATFTLHGWVGGAVPGSSFIVKFGGKSDDPTPSIGCLTTVAYMYNYVVAWNQPYLFANTGLLWSDNSELTHTASECGSNGSMDWTNVILSWQSTVPTEVFTN